MDQAHSKAVAAIQPFVVEATTTKAPTPRYLADLITRATSAPGTYVFTELLQTSAIQSLRTADAQPHLALLEIFSWGTYEEYQNTPNLPALSDTQSHKLRQLSLLTLASPFTPPSQNDATTTSSPHNLTYASLLKALSLPTPQSLESLVTSSIYSNLLTARLSPTASPTNTPTVHITAVAPLRDLRPQSLPALLSILQTWSSRCSDVITDLESTITSIRSGASQRAAVQRKRQALVDTAVATVDKMEDTKGSMAAGPKIKNRLGNKRDLDERMEGENEDGTSGVGGSGVFDGGNDDAMSSDDLRMDVDDDGTGPGSAGVAGAGAGAARGSEGGSAAAGANAMRGTKRNRGRG